MKFNLQSAVIGLAGAGAAWWLIQRVLRNYEIIGPLPQWTKDEVCPSREFWIDETIEASFPASDPPSSTPVSGTGRLSR